jgi:hypothetical protein
MQCWLALYVEPVAVVAAMSRTPVTREGIALAGCLVNDNNLQQGASLAKYKQPFSNCNCSGL